MIRLVILFVRALELLYYILYIVELELFIFFFCLLLAGSTVN
jgi:hypothetical protein